VLPESRVLIVSPIAPHNLNVRPLVVPDSTQIVLRMHSRDEKVVFTADNRTALIPSDTEIGIGVAQFSLKRVQLNRSNFIDALTEKLFWGEDVRNIK
jgi:NAD+ kinase